ncbi:DUF4224 domain-containing protein [Burkholderia glumae]|nr:DUF4224 domain-containing protein [Burkholderia glumae]
MRHAYQAFPPLVGQHQHGAWLGLGREPMGVGGGISEDGRMSTGLMTPEDLVKVTHKKRYSAQAKWFKAQYGVDVPQRTDGSIVLTWETLDALAEAKLGIRAADRRIDASPDRPPIHVLRKA